MPVRRLLLIGDDFRMPHGVVNYTLPLARGLAKAGLEVHYFYSGSYFHAYDLRLLPRLERFRQDDIRFYRIVNSPIYAQVPGSPEADLADPVIERMLASVLRRVRPEVAYVDSLLGLPSRSLAVIGGQGIPIVLTHHVYRLFCQQGVFFDRDGRFCGGPLDPERCARCFRQDDARKYILTAQLRSNPVLSGLLDRFGFPVVRALREFRGRGFGGPARGERAGEAKVPPGAEPRPAEKGDRPVERPPACRPGPATEQSRPGDARQAGAAAHTGSGQGAEHCPAGEDRPARHSASGKESARFGGVESLGRRLEARFRQNVDLLNRHVAVNICVSEDVRRNLLRFGVRQERLLVQHIGSAAAERFRPRQHPLDPGEVVIGNIGGLGPYKGTRVLVEALSRLRHRGNWKAFLFGKANEGYQEELEAVFQDPRIRYTGPYRFEEIDSLVDRIDLTVLPSVCNDTAPQTIFESFSGRVPIMASDIGGFPDFIRPGENGFLFEPGNAGDLAAKLEMVLREPGMIDRMSARIKRPKTLSENISELLNLFSRLHRERSGR